MLKNIISILGLEFYKSSEITLSKSKEKLVEKKFLNFLIKVSY